MKTRIVNFIETIKKKYPTLGERKPKLFWLHKPSQYLIDKHFAMRLVDDN